MQMATQSALVLGRDSEVSITKLVAQWQREKIRFYFKDPVCRVFLLLFLPHLRLKTFA